MTAEQPVAEQPETVTVAEQLETVAAEQPVAEQPEMVVWAHRRYRRRGSTTNPPTGRSRMSRPSRRRCSTTNPPTGRSGCTTWLMVRPTTADAGQRA